MRHIKYCRNCGIKFSEYIHFFPKFCPNCGIKVDTERIEKFKCSICHNLIENNHIIECPYCNNFFHYKCLANWLSKYNVCPICLNSYLNPKNKI